MMLLGLTALAMPLAAAQPGFVLGGDVPFLAEVEAQGGVFVDEGAVADPLAVFRAHRLSMARLRLWHDPAGGVNGLVATLAMARRLHDAGFDLLLGIHYSDTWADPGHQTKFDFVHLTIYQTLQIGPETQIRSRLNGCLVRNPYIH